jgi:hypothetical protein
MGQPMDLLIDQSTWVPVISIVGRPIDPIAELHATAITCQLSRHHQIRESHLDSKKSPTRSGEDPKKSWSNFTAVKSGASQNPVSLFTVDNSQIFGALVSKDHGTAPYKDWITDANTSQTDIAGVSAFRNVTNPQSAAKIMAVRTLLNPPHKACLPCAT